MDMYRAVKQDKLADFIIANPDVVAKEK
jgi:hypothetical protein